MATFENLAQQWQNTLLSPLSPGSKSRPDNSNSVFKYGEMGDFSNSNIGNSGDFNANTDNQLNNQNTGDLFAPTKSTYSANTAGQPTKPNNNRQAVNDYLKQLGYTKNYDNITITELENDPRVDKKNLYPLLVDRNFNNMAQVATTMPKMMAGVQKQVTDFRNTFAPPSQ